EQLHGGLDVVELLVLAQVVKSKREARQMVETGAISVNGQRVDLSYRLVESALLHHSYALIRRGKKTWHVVRFS
ncbi:MAG TPA: S4 domain-containing protein, partial [Polyangiaceae bacterium]|nr:S4 domain-containing protein [Polyangiaceae bacterium]